VWNNASFCLLCLWKERNDRSFENYEKTVAELFFNTLYLWTVTFVFPNLLGFNNFLGLFFSF